MKFFLLLIGFIGVGTVAGMSLPTVETLNGSAAEPEGELFGVSSQTISGHRDEVYADALTCIRDAIRKARDLRQPGADTFDVSIDAPQSILVSVDLPGGGVLHQHILFEDESTATSITQKVIVTGTVSARSRSTLEGMRSTGAFNMLLSGEMPPLA